MICVVDADGSTFRLLESMDLEQHDLVHVADILEVRSLPSVELVVIVGFRNVPWTLLTCDERRLDALVLARGFDETEALEAIARGLVGYVDLDQGPEAIRQAILACARGEPSHRAGVLGRWLREHQACARAHCNIDRLTERQRDVLRLVGDGRSDRDIAERLGISVGTAQKHVANILTRLGVSNRAAAAAAVCQHLRKPVSLAR